ncbi:hypothetical protein [Arenicella sp. 4NH20-0111]|uniref:hypothetical protein n=1 Tax=Arenicella sp. 4NH20-0111 TaxID=3127648 RepID=UPI00334076CF
MLTTTKSVKDTSIGSAIVPFIALLALNAYLRYLGILENVLYADDFLYFVDLNSTVIKYDICRFPPQDYRWITMGNICLSGTYLGEFVLSIWPKVLAIFFVTLYTFLLYRVLMLWGVRSVSALLLAALLAAHPITNEVILWNVTASSGLIISTVIYSYMLLIPNVSSWTARLCSFSLLLLVSISYEYALVIFLVLGISECFVLALSGRKVSFERLVVLISCFVFASLFYIVQSKVSASLFPDPAGARGISNLSLIFTDTATLVLKLRSLLNLMVNVYMTPLSFYFEIESLWSLWKWVPIGISVTIAGVVFLTTRSYVKSTVYSFFFIAITLIPLLPLLVASQSPESWRVSIPILIAAIIGITPIFIVLKKLPSYFTHLCNFCLSFFVLIPLAYVSISETKLRVYENRLESNLVSEIEAFWKAEEIDLSRIRVGRITYNEDDLNRRQYAAENLSISFQRRGLLLGFKNDIAWRSKLLYYGLDIIELESDTSEFAENYAKECTEGQCDYSLGEIMFAKCKKESNQHNREANMGVVHDLELRVTALCI